MVDKCQAKVEAAKEVNRDDPTATDSGEEDDDPTAEETVQTAQLDARLAELEAALDGERQLRAAADRGHADALARCKAEWETRLLQAGEEVDALQRELEEAVAAARAGHQAELDAERERAASALRKVRACSELQQESNIEKSLWNLYVEKDMHPCKYRDCVDQKNDGKRRHCCLFCDALKSRPKN